MKIEYDKNKSEKNLKERNLSFDEAIYFDWQTAIYKEDTRKLYSEKRMIAMGFLNQRIHVICFTETKEGIRIISFRKANKREVKRYEEETIDK
jgi:hypothetical protein